MPMTDEVRDTYKGLLGKAFEAADDDQLVAGMATFTKAAVDSNIELSTSNEELTTKVQNLEAQILNLSADDEDEPTTQLSATEKRQAATILDLKIDGIADKQQWPDAYRKEVKDAFKRDDMVVLSAGGDEANPTLPLLALDLLAKRPAKGLRADGTEITPTQAPGTLLSRVDEEVGEGDAAANPLLETANKMAGK